MACFSRGLMAPGLRTPFSPRLFLSPYDISASRARLFTTSLRLHASTTTTTTAASSSSPKSTTTRKPTPQSTTSRKPTSRTSSIPPSSYAFVKSLGSKPTPTTLYEGPSHFWFYFGCWTTGAFLISWTVLTGPSAVSQPEGVPQWVGLVFGAAYVILGSMGVYIISKTPNIVHSIRLLPMQHTAMAGTAAGAAVVGAARSAPQLEVVVKRMIPAMSPKVLTTDLDNVTLKTRFSLPSEYVPDLKRQELERAEKKRREELFKFDMEHLFTMPFRRMGRAVIAMFRGVRAAWTDSGFGVIKVDGKDYKVDVTQGFAHDGFRTLERIVKISEDD